ncbi:MAG: hypothetical protein FIA92_18110 [Chloroflexi bacterium]|nr:hypothetical protein [Chloroflexota bacterium]
MAGIKVTEPPAGKSVRITTATTTSVKTSRGIILRIIVGTTAAGTITVQNTAGTAAAVLKASIPEGVYELGIEMNGIVVVTGAASDITVVYL